MTDSRNPSFHKLQNKRSSSKWIMIRTLLRAHLAATLVAAAPFLVVILPMSIGSSSDAWWESPLNWLAIISVVAGASALAGMICGLLPATILLKAKGAETHSNYLRFGAAVGALLPFLVGLQLAEPRAEELLPLIPFSILGIFSGLTAAHIWGSYREDLAARQSSPSAGKNKPNPIHELLH